MDRNDVEGVGGYLRAAVAELPRLLFCTFDVVPAPTGMSRRLTEYLAAVEDRFAAVVLSLKTPDHSHIEKFRGARLLRVPVGAGDLAARLQAFDRAVRRQLESEEYAVAHFTDPFGGYALCETRNDYGHKLVYEAQAFPSQELRHTHPGVASDRRFLNKIRRQELFCLMNADQVVTGTTFTRNFIHSLGVPAENVRVLRAPVDLSLYRPEVLGLPDGQPLRALYLGSAAEWQGLELLLDAVKLAASEVKLFVTLAGPRSLEAEGQLQDRIESLGIADVVSLQAPVTHDEVFKLVAASDVGLLPLAPVERNSAQGGALAKAADYLAAGRPVLAADVGVAREVITDDAGLFFEPGNAEALAAELVRLAKDPALRVKLGRRARALAEERHDAARIKRQLLDLYQSLLGAGVRPEARSNGTEATSIPTLVGTGLKRAPTRKKKKTGSEPSTDPAIRRREEPITDPNAEQVRTDRAEPLLGKPPPQVTPESFVGALPVSPLLTGGARTELPAGKPPIPEPAAALGSKLPPPPSNKLPPLPASKSSSFAKLPDAPSTSTRPLESTTSASVAAVPRPSEPAPLPPRPSSDAAPSLSPGRSPTLPELAAPRLSAAARSAEPAPRASDSLSAPVRPLTSAELPPPLVKPASEPPRSDSLSTRPLSPTELPPRPPELPPARSDSLGAPVRALSSSELPRAAEPASATVRPPEAVGTLSAPRPLLNPPIGGGAPSSGVKKLPPIGGGKKPAIEEPHEISADEVEEAEEAEEAEDASLLAEPVDADEPDHVSEDEVAEVPDTSAKPGVVQAQPGALLTPSRALAMPPPTHLEGEVAGTPAEPVEAVSKLDPWYAQLVHGYAPPAPIAPKPEK